MCIHQWRGVSVCGMCRGVDMWGVCVGGVDMCGGVCARRVHNDIMSSFVAIMMMSSCALGARG